MNLISADAITAHNEPLLRHVQSDYEHLGEQLARRHIDIDAVRHLGVSDIQMPCTPERVWRAIHAHDGDAPTPADAMPHFEEGALNQDPTSGEGAGQ